MQLLFRNLESLKEKFLRPGAPAWSTVMLALLAMALVAVIAWKTDRSAYTIGTRGQNDLVALSDYCFATHFPVRDLLNGGNPYNAGYAERNPDGERFPPYSPLHLGLHLPFGLMSYETARWIFFSWNVVLIMVAAWLVVRIVGPRFGWNAVLAVAVLMLASRPGYKTLFYGQVMPLVLIGTYLALWQARRRPWLAALGLALVSVKAQFVLPLGVLMLFRGNFGAVWRGAVLATAGAAIPVTILAVNEGGFGAMAEVIYRNYFASEGLPGVHEAGYHWLRIDFAAQLAVLTGVEIPKYSVLGIAAGLWAAGGLVMLRTRDREDLGRADGASTALILGLTLLSLYHLIYDFLLLALPLSAVLLREAPVWKRIPGWQWLAIAAGLGLCFVNHLVQKMALGLQEGTWIWRAGVSANTAALFFAMGLLAWVLLKAPSSRERQNAER